MEALLLRVAPRLASQLGRVDHHRPVLMHSGLATDEFILCYLFLIFIIFKKYV
jgi:hypothetical protein